MFFNLLNELPFNELHIFSRPVSGSYGQGSYIRRNLVKVAGPVRRQDRLHRPGAARHFDEVVLAFYHETNKLNDHFTQ